MIALGSTVVHDALPLQGTAEIQSLCEEAAFMVAVVGCIAQG